MDVRVHVGMGTDAAFLTESVDEARVALFQEVFAEFEILDMTAHDAHYALGTRRAIPAGAVPAPYEPEIRRAVSSDVIGNIGEGLGMATLCQVAGFEPDEVARIRRQRVREPAVMKRTPDFAICTTGGRAPWTQLASKLPSLGALKSAAALYPRRFPVESKSSIGTGGGRWDALWQLVEYWHTVTARAHEVAGQGCGVIVETNSVGVDQRSVVIRILSPQRPADFIAALHGPLPPKRNTKGAFTKRFGASVFHGD